MSKRRILCYAERSGNEWEAFCVDFDLAVQGTSFREVQTKLHDQIHLFLETVEELPESERRKLLGRRMPLKERARLRLRLNVHNIVRGEGRRQNVGSRKLIQAFPARA